MYNALCNKNLHLAARDLFNKRKTAALSRNTPSLECKDCLKQNCILQKIWCLLQKQMLHHYLCRALFSERCSAAAFKGRLHYERHMHFVHETLPIKLCSSLKHAISFVAILDIERLLNIFKITARFKECCIFCSNTACFERILSILRVFKKYCTFCRSSWCPLNRILHWEK